MTTTTSQRAAWSHYEPIPRYMSQTEVGAFFSVVRQLRDRVLFTLVYQYGLRVSEVSLIRRSDLDLARHRILIRRVKGGAWSERPLFEQTERLVKRYLATVPGDDSEPLFPGRSGPLKKRQIQTLFERHRRAAGLPDRFTCHCLRHSIATHLLDAGERLEFVQDHLGHRNIRSTTIYARITDRHRATVFERLERSPWIVRPARLSRNR